MKDKTAQHQYKREPETVCSKCDEITSDQITTHAEHLKEQIIGDAVETPPKDYSKLLNTSDNEPCCTICDREIPSYVEYVKKDEDRICSRCIKKLNDKIDEDQIRRWEKEVITPNAL